MTPGSFWVQHPVGPAQTNVPSDILKVKGTLNRFGSYDVRRSGWTPEATKDLFDAIRLHQGLRRLRAAIGID